MTLGGHEHGFQWEDGIPERRSLMIMQTYKFYSLTDAEFGLVAALTVMTLLLASRYAW
jgi:hypothetical protein